MKYMSAIISSNFSCVMYTKKLTDGYRDVGTDCLVLRDALPIV